MKKKIPIKMKRCPNALCQNGWVKEEGRRKRRCRKCHGEGKVPK